MYLCHCLGIGLIPVAKWGVVGTVLNSALRYLHVFVMYFI